MRVMAHSGNPGNKSAHNMERGFIGRAVRNDPSSERTEEGLISYQEITQYLKLTIDKRDHHVTKVLPRLKRLDADNSKPIHFQISS